MVDFILGGCGSYFQRVVDCHDSDLDDTCIMFILYVACEHEIVL